MPFKSSDQRKFLFANYPDVAARYAAETPKGKKLPKKVKKKKK
jgi:hypothetical protein